MSDECPKISVSLVVGGDDFDPETLSQRMDIAPTRVWSQKIQHLRERSDLPNCEWEYKLEKLETGSIDDAIRKVLDVFWEKKDSLRDFVADNKLSVAIVLYVFNEEMDPEYVISPNTMKRLAECGAELCMQLDD